VYALAIEPSLLPTVHTWSEVSGKVLGGAGEGGGTTHPDVHLPYNSRQRTATLLQTCPPLCRRSPAIPADLFLQGVLQPPGGLPDFLAGSPRSLSVPGNPLPFAVGRMAVSKAEAVREGMRGRGVTLLHVYSDLLWQMGDKAPPNDGFTPARIFPLEQPEAAAAPAAPGEPGAPTGGAGEAAAAQLGGLQLEEGGEAAAAADAAPSSAAAAPDAAQAGEAVPAAAGPDGGGAVDMDALLEAAVLAGLQTLKNAELPIQTGGRAGAGCPVEGAQPRAAQRAQHPQLMRLQATSTRSTWSLPGPRGWCLT
jgi:translation initiation factor 2D